MKVGVSLRIDANSKFNMWNTNGRRRDITDAYTKYLTILDDEFGSGKYEWGNFPKSIGQFVFYTKAVESSPEIFKDTNKLDNFNNHLKNDDYKEAFLSLNKTKFLTLSKGKELLTDLDKNLEARARHYTSNLVKVGFAYNNRTITKAGYAYLNENLPYLDLFEKILPINSINLILLRQLAKLRVYKNSGEMYYSPFNMLMYALLKSERISDAILFKMIELLNPSLPIEPTSFIDEIMTSSFEEVQLAYNNKIDGNLKFPNLPMPMDFGIFSKYFTSQKNSRQIEVYYEFYTKNYKFFKEKTQENLNELIFLLKDRKKGPIIKTAFGGKYSVYNVKKTLLNDFIEANADNVFLNSGDNNAMYYSEFKYSKRNSNVREYNRNFRKVAIATGIFHIKNGVAELAYKDIWREFLDLEFLEQNIFVKSTKEEMKAYEESMESDFFNNVPLSKIFGYNEVETMNIVTKISNRYSLTTSEEVKEQLKSKLSKDFEEFVKENFTKDFILEILPLFSDRTKDNKIKEMMGVESSVPTIFEYIVGLAWYYISDKKYDLYSSFNLTMTADFLPEKFAGGGYGDIIVNYDDEIIQIEVTLMDKNAQKRGEWEPVLRHATNLTIEVEPKPVTTLFVADELDDNTINIWRAVASVPLKSSKEIATEGHMVENVKIMPLTNFEIVKLLEEGRTGQALVSKVNNSFSKLPQKFDLKWRDKILT